MIIASFDRGTVVWEPETGFRVEPDSAPIRNRLSRPVWIVEGVETEVDGVPVNERRRRRVGPGTAEHARQSIRELPGGTVLVDDED